MKEAMVAIAKLNLQFHFDHSLLEVSNLYQLSIHL